MSCAETFSYAINYAVGGHPMGEALAAAIASQAEVLQRFPTSAALFMPAGDGQTTPAVGETWCNKGLGRVLQSLATAEARALSRGCSRAEGVAAACACFYTGEVGDELVGWLRANGGLLTKDDMAAHSPQVAVGETVILLYCSLPLVGVSIGKERRVSAK